MATCFQPPAYLSARDMERIAWNREADLKRRTKKAAKRALKAMGAQNINRRKT